MSVSLRAVLALATALTFAVLSGCNVTTHSSSCSNNECTVSLNGAGSDTTLYNDTLSITLEGADGDTADLTVNLESVSCGEGETKNVEKVEITCDTVGDDEVDLTVVG
jgi:ABC-type phosphate transport system substrate-binding protein